MEDKPISIENAEVEALVGDIKFYSVTYRLWKIEGLEADCEDYGQAVVYKGGVPEEPHGFQLDDHHYFPKGKVMSVCGNTFKMLQDTRFAPFFEFIGTWDTHYGIFEGCGGNAPFSTESSGAAPAAGSCC